MALPIIIFYLYFLLLNNLGLYIINLAKITVKRVINLNKYNIVKLDNLYTRRNT